MTIYIKYFYLNTPMARYEYMPLKLCDITEDVTKHYNLATKVKNGGCVYIEIRRRIYGLPNRDYSPNSYWKSDST